MKHYSSQRTLLAAAILTGGVASVMLPQASKVALAAPAAVRYKIDPGRSSFTVSAAESGLVNATRHMATKNVTGWVQFNGGKPATAQVTVNANSLRSDLSGIEGSKINDAVHGPILQTDKYPNIVFKASRIAVNKPSGPFRGTVSGMLTLHGVTRAISVPVTGSISGNTATATGSTTIKQSQYNITLLSLMAGAISVKDPVSIKFTITARK